MIVEKFFIFTCLVLVWDLCASDDASSEDSSERDRRGTYNLHKAQRIGSVSPPLSAIAPLSVFADAAAPSRTSIYPAILEFHKRLPGVPLSALSAEGPFRAGLERVPDQGYSAAQPFVQHRPVILGPFSQSIPETELSEAAVSGCSSSGSRCSALVYCAPFFEEVVESNQGCLIAKEAPGACCRTSQGVSTVMRGYSMPGPTVFAPFAVVVEIRAFSVEEIDYAVGEAFAALKNRDHIEKELQYKGIVVNNPQRPAYGHLQFFKTSVRAMKISRAALIQNFAGESLKRSFKLTPAQAGFGLQQVNTLESRVQSTCPPNPRCNKKAKFYRTPDGSCNNIYNPKWGEARTAFERILPPRYADGFSEPRRSVTGDHLPSARVVSLANVPDVDRPSQEFTLSVMQWGQFIDHDLTHAPIFRFGNRSGIECCDERGNFVMYSLQHPACFPISIPEDDPFFSQFGRRCMNFVRSMPAPRNNCTLGFREQMNQVTHFLDGSAVYGSSHEDEEELREHTGGLLKEQEQGLLPSDRFATEEDCFLEGTGLNCFLAGDSRVNEQPHLSVIHTMWVRQHNRIARELARLNPHWSDETVFQETKRIVVAQIQHIVYNEWLPIILGTETVEMSDLLPLRDAFSDSYDKFLNPNIRNEFATVAFRFGHTLVEGMLRLFGKRHSNEGSLDLFEHFNRPSLLYQPDKFDELLRGLFKQPMQSFDNFVADDLTNRLFQTETMPFGMDLIALNTQRGRDHGVATYNDLREVCGLPRARSFDDLKDFLRPDTIATFRNIYASVDDVDPFVAGISEVPVNGGVLGPTFNCIIRDQFRRLRFGDRFFYENGGMPSSFTEAQLFELKKTSWASIICENSGHIKKIQPLAFRLPGPNNEKLPCGSEAIPKLDLTPWISAHKMAY